MPWDSFYTDVVSRALTPKHQHHDRFYQSLLEYQEISAQIQALRFSDHHVVFFKCDSFLSGSFKIAKFCNLSK